MCAPEAPEKRGEHAEGHQGQKIGCAFRGELVETLGKDPECEREAHEGHVGQRDGDQRFKEVTAGHPELTSRTPHGSGVEPCYQPVGHGVGHGRPDQKSRRWHQRPADPRLFCLTMDHRGDRSLDVPQA